MPQIIKSLEIVKEPTRFESWMIMRQNNMFVIGDARFKGNPNANGEVDIGYSIIEKEQKKGYGFETAKKLADWAFLQQDVKHIRASCLISNIASARIIEKVGMQKIKEPYEKFGN